MGVRIARRLTFATVGWLCALVCVFVAGVAATPASAGLVHPYKSETTGTTSGPFSFPFGIAVDPASQFLYVTDIYNGRVDIFNSAGVYQSQISGISIPAGETFRPSSVAVSDKTGDVYVTSGENYPVNTPSRVYVFNALGEYVTTITGSTTPEKSFGFPGSVKGVAVDQSNGDFYVVDGFNHVVDRFNSANEYQSQLTFAGTPEGVAVDSSGNVYVSEEGGIYKFDSSGTQTLHIEGVGGYAVAVDSAGNIYAAGRGAVDELDSSGVLVNQTSTFVKSSGAPTSNFANILGVAVNAAGDMYVSDQGQGVVDVLGPNVLVPGVSGEPATGVSDSAASLHGLVNPEGTEVGSCVFEYRTAAEPEFGHRSAACSPGTPYTGTANVPVEATVNSLEANTTYYYRLVASNAKGAAGGPGYGPEESFKTVGAPRIEGVSAEVNPTEKVGQTTATLHAQIDPDGRETTYTFEYGETKSYGTSIPISAEAIGSGEAFVPVTAELSGLKIGTTYHYRVSASNEFGTVPSADQTFSTLPAVLIEHESVSDVAATSATLEAQVDPLGASSTCVFQYVSDVSFQSSGYGAAVSVPCPSPLGEGEVGVSASVHLQGFTADTLYHYRAIATSAVGTSDGEDNTFTTERVGESLALPDGREWELVSPADKHGARIETIVAGVTQASAVGGAMTYLASAPTELVPQGYTNQAQVLSTRGAGGWESRVIAPRHDAATGVSIGTGQEYRFFSEDLSVGVVQPFGNFTLSLSSEASEQTAYLRRDYPPGDVGDPCSSSCYRPLVTGAAGYANVAPGTVFGEEPSGECAHFLCGPQFVGASPDGSHVIVRSSVGLTSTPRDEGGLYEWADGKLKLVSVLPDGEPASKEAMLGSENGINRSFRHAVSDDGSRVVWGGGFVRDVPSGRTVSLPGGFQTASGDGSRVFVTNADGLVECQIVEVAGELTCKSTDLGPGLGVLAVVGASEDGSYVYFVSGSDTLYVSHAGTTRAIATLSGEDQAGLWGQMQHQTARISPDGRWLAFMSQRSLTGYDNRDAISGQPDEEVFLYDASSGRLACASCNPTGARPVGVRYEQEDRVARLVGGNLVWAPSTGLAANVPGWTPYMLGRELYQPRYLSDNGRLFFNSSDALVPQDVNGNEDVYQFEPVGVGGCASASATFGVRSGGCVGLLSSGADAGESAFLDASGNGGDVFFLTAGKLVPQDFDVSLDVYDAHECTAQSPCQPVPAALPPACSTGDSCKAAPSPQPSIFGDPASATFSGAGNLGPAVSGAAVKLKRLTRAQKLANALRACRRRPKGKRAGCMRRAQRAYGTQAKAKARRAAKGSSAGRVR
jgi:DNA-binding beta-propeller fold protein YncE